MNHLEAAPFDVLGEDPLGEEEDELAMIREQ
jgi:hypothetical protein